MASAAGTQGAFVLFHAQTILVPFSAKGQKFRTVEDFERTLEYISKMRLAMLITFRDQRVLGLTSKDIRNFNYCCPSVAKVEPLNGPKFPTYCGYPRLCPFCWGRDVCDLVWRNISRACKDYTPRSPFADDTPEHVLVAQSRTFKLDGRRIESAALRMKMEAEKIITALELLPAAGYCIHYVLYPGSIEGSLGGRITTVYLTQKKIGNDPVLRTGVFGRKDAIMLDSSAYRDIDLVDLLSGFFHFPTRLVTSTRDWSPEVWADFTDLLMAAQHKARTLRFAGVFRRTNRIVSAVGEDECNASPELASIER